MAQSLGPRANGFNKDSFPRDGSDPVGVAVAERLDDRASHNVRAQQLVKLIVEVDRRSSVSGRVFIA